jgi:hypothetical protein
MLLLRQGLAEAFKTTPEVLFASSDPPRVCTRPVVHDFTPKDLAAKPAAAVALPVAARCC